MYLASSHNSLPPALSLLTYRPSSHTSLPYAPSLLTYNVPHFLTSSSHALLPYALSLLTYPPSLEPRRGGGEKSAWYPLFAHALNYNIKPRGFMQMTSQIFQV